MLGTIIAWRILGMILDDTWGVRFRRHIKLPEDVMRVWR